MTTTTRGLAEFKAFLKDVRSIGGLMGKLSIALPPALMLLSNFGPPWVGGGGGGKSSHHVVSFLTSLIQIVTLMIVFHEGPFRCEKRLTQWFRFTAVMVVLTTVLYLALFVIFVRDMPDEVHRDVRGFVYTEIASRAIGLTYTEADALRGAGYDPTRVWIPWTVYVIRILIIAFWLLMFSSIAAFFGIFVLKEKRTSVTQRASRK